MLAPRLVQQWLAREGRQIRLHFVPTYSPHLNPIERTSGVMHRNITHNRCFATFRDFKAATMAFLIKTVPKTGPTSTIRSPTPSASSIPQIFGS